MRLFGSERLMKIFTSLGVAENEQIEHKMLSNAIQKAQEKIEFNNFGIRKNLLDYDQVNNEQREIIYKERRRVLDGESMRDSIFKMITDTIDNVVDLCIGENADPEDWNLTELNEVLIPVIPVKVIQREDVYKRQQFSLLTKPSLHTTIRVHPSAPNTQKADRGRWSVCAAGICSNVRKS